MMSEPDPTSETAWIDALKARGWQHTCLTLLDVLEPVAPLAAQFLWMAQPTARVLGGDTWLKGLASALEDPDALERLRAHLREEDETS